jgi:hypothetical protein
VLRAGKAAADFREQLAAPLQGTPIDGSANVLPTFSAPVGTTTGKPDANTHEGKQWGNTFEPGSKEQITGEISKEQIEAKEMGD